MNEEIKIQYCRQVGKHLVCSKKTKAQLLQGLRESIDDISDPDINTVTDLENCLGTIREISKDLQQAVTEDERESVLKKQKQVQVFIMCVIIGFAIMLCILSICYFRNGPYTSVELIKEG